MYVFGSGLLGAFLFLFFVEDKTFPYGWILVLEIVPGFSLYRGLYELGQYAFFGSAMGAAGMTWESLKEPINGMRDVLIIMSVESMGLLILAFYLDQASLLGGGVGKKTLYSASVVYRRRIMDHHCMSIALSIRIPKSFSIWMNQMLLKKEK
uniref:Uncharacterized protein n=1 Tax=Arundo donax TaxID=35708 RepID=A0A0A9EK71_ARUDO